MLIKMISFTDTRLMPNLPAKANNFSSTLMAHYQEIKQILDNNIITTKLVHINFTYLLVLRTLTWTSRLDLYVRKPESCRSAQLNPEAQTCTLRSRQNAAHGHRCPPVYR